jgi:hypothetical protein
VAAFEVLRDDLVTARRAATALANIPDLPAGPFAPDSAVATTLDGYTWIADWTRFYADDAVTAAMQLGKSHTTVPLSTSVTASLEELNIAAGRVHDVAGQLRAFADADAIPARRADGSSAFDDARSAASKLVAA